MGVASTPGARGGHTYLFLGAGRAGGPGAEGAEQAVEGAALRAAAALVPALAQLLAAAPPVVLVILELSATQSQQ